MLRPARHRLPPLNTLRFFEAAARHGSFARAAAELCITAGAVSRQVKVLEESLGVALFHRHPQRLEITRTGKMLLRTVQDAINSIEQETRRIETDKNVVRIGLSPNFAVRWMSSRLHELKAEFPSLRLVIDASPELSDLSAGEVDFVIRFGSGYWDGAEAEPLFGGGLIAVGSGPLLTRYRASTGTIKKGLPLIHVESTTDWSAWLESSGASLGDQRADILVSHAHIAVEAAVNGAGAALVHPALVARELKLGYLRRLSFHTLDVKQSYWMARQSKRKPTNQSRKIMNWLRSRATEERDWLDRHQHA